jgi:hypothetical protein
LIVPKCPVLNITEQKKIRIRIEKDGDLSSGNRARSLVRIWTEIQYEEAEMKRKGFTPEQIIGKLREKVLLSEGTTAEEASRILGTTERTYQVKNSSAFPF